MFRLSIANAENDVLRLAVAMLPAGGTVGTPVLGGGGRSVCTVAMTVLVEASITETVPAPPFLTYTRAPSGVTASDSGPLPTGMDPRTVLVLVSITLTLFRVARLLPKLAT